MAKIKRSRPSFLVTVRSDYPAQGTMTVGLLREFVTALNEENIPDGATLEAERDYIANQFKALWVRHTVFVDGD